MMSIQQQKQSCRLLQLVDKAMKLNVFQSIAIVLLIELIVAVMYIAIVL